MESENYLTKSLNSLTAAQICLENELFDDAVNRAYYAVLRSALAFLARLNFSPRTRQIHHWTQSVFPRECVKRRKVMPQRMASYLAQLQNLRDAADYKPEFVSEKTATRAVSKASEFVHIIRQEMRSEEGSED